MFPAGLHWSSQTCNPAHFPPNMTQWITVEKCKADADRDQLSSLLVITLLSHCECCVRFDLKIAHMLTGWMDVQAGACVDHCHVDVWRVTLTVNCDVPSIQT